MSAAVSDVDNTSLIDLMAVKRGHGIVCFDAVAALGQAPETELIFIEAQKERERGKITSLTHCCRKIAWEHSNRV